MAAFCLFPSPFYILPLQHLEVLAGVSEVLSCEFLEAVLALNGWCPAHSEGSVTVTGYGNEWTNKPWPPHLYCSAPSTTPKKWHQKSRLKATLCYFTVPDATSIDNTISIIITVWLFQMQMSQLFPQQAQKAFIPARVLDEGTWWC